MNHLGSSNLQLPATMSTFRVDLLRFNLPKTPITSRVKLMNPTSASFNTKHSGSATVVKLSASPKADTISTGGFAVSSKENSRIVFAAAVSVGVALLVMGFDDGRAMALGPEGPLLEDFWDNMRRYGLYALTVSTGAIYALVEPIVELLKNPISAILVVIIFGGGFYIVSQVVTAMVGLSDFAYDLNY